MEDIFTKYEEAVQEENILIQRIGLCKEIIDFILEYISKNAVSIHMHTAEDIVTAIHRIGQDLDTELLHLQLEMGFLECEIKSVRAQECL
ncbi:hypothetical protein BVG16_23860 [Paenibacillus selenitireducens]|uniref:Uncharacterized protein n=1 Tax=Paenibacillus selenitireducens TaxID=1324314 RepID=A0A1T2X2X9_9BACL|nr:hypothetical protein [Paenibacillus selenitireducens]OPA74175.1 hypothetical protein BVG16_23860 [Paenibacillus selenitireducens]